MHLPTQNQLSPTHSQSLVLPFSAIDRTMLNLVGGKAANLGELTQAKLPVPPGFCVTTSAYLLIADQANLTSLIKQVSHADTGHGSSLANNASLIRASILATDLPAAIAEAITTAYHDLSGGKSVAVAVRSSATAEDLPFASFAGQQDTYLNIVGVAAVLDAVRRCWASLWTERAISYRTSNEIDQSTVSLAVVIQRMVDAEVAGVLFTANPLTGCRRQMVIDANPGLGEAVVSGMVNPDHVVVDVDTGAIVGRSFGDKRIRVQSVEGGGTEHISLSEQNGTFCLTDDQIHSLVGLGTQVEAYYGTPQDIEWAIDNAGQYWLVQARPITTLFPLPAEAAQAKDTLRVYLSVNVIQGVYRPLTPLGVAAFRLIASSLVTFMGLPVRDRVAGPPFVIEAAQRLFFDITTPLRNAWGRNLLTRVMGAGEARSARVFQELSTDPRLALVPFSRPALIRRVVTFVWRARMPHYALQALLRPVAARARVMTLRDQLAAQSKLVPSVSAEERMTEVEQFLGSKLIPIFLSIVPVVLINLAVMIPLTRKLLGNSATEDERQVVLRGLPYNPTTEMDLTLWHIAQRLSSDDAIAQLLATTPSEQLAQRYREGTLPGTLQRELTDFLQVYGHRGVAEIDLGVPRWSEDPTHILGVLANYLRLKNPELAPDVQFRRGAQEAEEMVSTLTRRASKLSWWRGLVVGFCLRRVRALVGLREMPKYCLILALTRSRTILQSIGEELAQAGQLANTDDIFFLTVPEVHQAIAGTDMRETVQTRQAEYAYELKRRRIPRVLLSDGTEPEAIAHASTQLVDGQLSGTPASAGIVTARARVILDPIGAHLEPGEILVAPSTDPGWTPLFLTASGLVMEMGGPISHGAVVAREYGIPAVVGVPGATTHIVTGQEITVDGSAGIVVVGHAIGNQGIQVARDENTQ